MRDELDDQKEEEGLATKPKIPIGAKRITNLTIPVIASLKS